MGKMIPFSACLRLNRKKERHGSDELPITSLTAQGTSMKAGEELIPGTSRIDLHTLPCIDQPEEASSSREPGRIEQGKIFCSFATLQWGRDSLEERRF